MTQEDKETLKWLLIEAKAIVDTDNQNPYAGIFLNNLCEVVDEFIEVTRGKLNTNKGGVSLGQNNYEVNRNPNIQYPNV